MTHPVPITDIVHIATPSGAHILAACPDLCYCLPCSCYFLPFFAGAAFFLPVTFFTAGFFAIAMMSYFVIVCNPNVCGRLSPSLSPTLAKDFSRGSFRPVRDH
jgi:hypothetical protein